MLMTLNINGKTVMRDAEARTTLADFLRDVCDLTATHLGCEQGACGACTVVVDGLAVRSCLLFAAMCEGRTIVTLEGLNDDPKIEVLRRHFHESHGLQCGFCTPGMILAAHALLARNVDPSRDDIVEAISGNICRCTGHGQIVEAIELAAERLRQANAPQGAAK